jgi:hypothetical protein
VLKEEFVPLLMVKVISVRDYAWVENFNLQTKQVVKNNIDMYMSTELHTEQFGKWLMQHLVPLFRNSYP